MYSLQVNDLLCLPLEKAEDPSEVTPILACQDRTLKVMQVHWKFTNDELLSILSLLSAAW